MSHIDEVMTIAEIRDRFPSEWILVEDPVTGESLDVERGRVRCHSPNRDEVYRAAKELKPRRFAMLHTGAMPAGAAIVL